MRKLIQCIIVFFAIFDVRSQTFEWAKSFGGTTSDYCLGVTVDNDGNIYTTGRFSGSADFDPGPGIVILNAEGEDDVFVQKFDASGNLLWVKSFGGLGADFGRKIVVDNFGNLYITGFFNQTVDFDPGVGIMLISTIGIWNSFVLKLNNLGDFTWVRCFRGHESSSSYGVSLDNFGNVFTVGSFDGTSDFDPGAGIYNLTSDESNDYFVQKMDSSGNFLWAKSFGGNHTDIAESVCNDELGNVYVTGYFSQTVDFDPGVGVTNLTSTGDYDAFVQKLDSAGNFIWVKSISGPVGELAFSSCLDAFGNIYTSGYFLSSADFDPSVGVCILTSAGERDIFVQKLDSNGNFLWAKSFGGPLDDFTYSVDVDMEGNVYTSGSFMNGVDFNPGVGVSYHESNGEKDVFLQKMDSSGNFLWANSFGGPSDDSANDFCLDGNNSIHVVGGFNGTADFDFGPSSFELSSNGFADAYLQKRNQNILNVNALNNNFKAILFPNPTNENANIAFDRELCYVDFVLSNLNGQVISKNHYECSSSINFDLPVEHGVYFLTVKTLEGQATVKVLKE